MSQTLMVEEVEYTLLIEGGDDASLTIEAAADSTVIIEDSGPEGPRGATGATGDRGIQGIPGETILPAVIDGGFW